jgi:hypothetical protein
MKINFVMAALGLLIALRPLVQDQIYLTDLEKTKEYLSLSDIQFKVVKQKVAQINEVLEEDERILAELKERIKNGNEPGFFEKISVKRGRDKRTAKLAENLTDIKNQLSEEQKLKYSRMVKPELKSLNREEIFGK